MPEPLAEVLEEEAEELKENGEVDKDAMWKPVALDDCRKDKLKEKVDDAKMGGSLFNKKKKRGRKKRKQRDSGKLVIDDSFYDLFD